MPTQLTKIHAYSDESKKLVFRVPICQQSNGHRGGRSVNSVSISDFKKLSEISQCIKCKTKLNKDV